MSKSLSATSGRILPFLSLLIPFWLVRVMTSWRETLADLAPAWPIIGGTFAAVQFLWSNFVGFELVDIVAVGRQHGGRSDRRSTSGSPENTWRFARDVEQPEPSRRSRHDRRGPGSTAGPTLSARANRSGLAALRPADRHRDALGPSTDQIAGHARGQGMARRRSSWKARAAEPASPGRKGRGRHRARDAAAAGPWRRPNWTSSRYRARARPFSSQP